MCRLQPLLTLFPLAFSAGSLLTAQSYAFKTIQSFQPNGANKLGVFVGQLGAPVAGVYAAGDFYTLIHDPMLPANGNTELFGLNSEGDIVGGSDVRGFLLKNGVFTTISINGSSAIPYAINDAGVIVGSYLSGEETLGFVLSGTKVQTFPYSVVGINNHGDLLFSNFDTGILEVGGTKTVIADPNAIETAALGLNDSDSVAGFYTDAEFVSHGFVYANGTYTTVDYPNATFTRAQAIDNEGRVGGFALTNSGLVGFTATPTN